MMKQNETKIEKCAYLPLLIMSVLFSLLVGCNQPIKEKKNKPNILLIVADDLGYGDIGCYGGDIKTPNIDNFANKGIRFSRFHTSPMCSPTRAMLMSGNDNHIAGVGGQSLVTNEFGYEGKLTDRIVTIPQLLKEAGYHTYLAGKWHLGKSEDANPHKKGFENSYALLAGAGNHYNNQSALRNGFSLYTENGKPIKWKEGNYSTDFYTDKLIQYIESNRADNKPFFAYAAYTSPHWPLQVDTIFWHKYKGMYDRGYEDLRKKRFTNLKRVGIIPKEATLPRLHERVRPWADLTEQEKKEEARKMELYAGMVDNLDYNIGRLIKYLKSIDEYKNTMIVFMSDNGAAHRDFINSKRSKSLKKYYNDTYENMGNADSYISYGPQWAEAGSSPFRYFKDYATEGGTNTTLIVSGANVQRKNEIHHGFLSVLDLAPTFYQLADIKYPEIYNGKKVYPLKGISLLPLILGNTKEIHSPEYVYALEHYGNAMLRKGNWKITNFKKPFNKDSFCLYNLSNDLGEQEDLKETETEKFNELLLEWEQFSKEIKLQIPTPKSPKGGH